MVVFVYLRSLVAGWHDEENWLCPLLTDSLSERELDQVSGNRVWERIGDEMDAV